jgi:hypothetical protein
MTVYCETCSTPNFVHHSSRKCNPTYNQNYLGALQWIFIYHYKSNILRSSDTEVEGGDGGGKNNNVQWLTNI